MNKCATLVFALAFLLVALVSASGFCDNAPCEKQINVSVGKDFTISLEANPGSTGYDWWTNFDSHYLSLLNSTFIPENAASGMIGASAMENFAFNAKRTGNTELRMLLLRPWVNGTIIESKLFLINIAQLSANKPIYNIQEYSRVKPPYYTVPSTTSR